MIRFMLVGSCLLLGLNLTYCKTHSESVLQNNVNSTSKKHVVILATNDIHGGIAPSFADDAKPTGGLMIWDAMVRATKQGVSPDTAVILVDAGDQFQGSLISNHSEGITMYAAMKQIGYDALIPGNHAYDFGPKDWLRDADPSEEADYEREQITRTQIAQGQNINLEIPDTTPARQLALRGSFIEAFTQAQVPIISANTYEMSSLVDSQGQKILVEPHGCKPVRGGAINWSNAKRPDGLSSHKIIDTSGLRIAVIGLDHEDTAATTVDVNVRDLCFRDNLETYIEIWEQIKNQADVFVLTIHDSDLAVKGSLSQLIENIQKHNPESIHAVVAGHTHRVDLKDVNGVPIVQSGSGGTMFGRIDLYLTANRKIDPSKTKAVSGIKMYSSKCAANASAFCGVQNGTVHYEGQPLVYSQSLKALIDNAQQSMLQDLRIKPQQKIGTAKEEITRDFNRDSPMGRNVTDLMRKITSADVALINSGSLRANFPKTTNGELTYEHLFNMLPFATRLMISQQVPASVLVETYKIAATGTKPYGVLLQSGLKVTVGKKANGETSLAQLATTSGQIIYDGKTDQILTNRTFKVATTDFLMRNKSGADGVKSQAKQEVGVLRELLADYLVGACNHGPCFEFVKTDDDRWETKNL